MSNHHQTGSGCTAGVENTYTLQLGNINFNEILNDFLQKMQEQIPTPNLLKT